ncbi:MAG TPA: hypothetical protein PK365_09105, partial [Nitrospira sp.]|nr:hypothetical protein [Nitrospira sp.]HNK77695.1 hypothetical protein [Nitrospira sp.]
YGQSRIMLLLKPERSYMDWAAFFQVIKMKVFPLYIVAILFLTGCVTAEMILGQRPVTKVKMGSTVDYPGRPFIDASDEIFSLSQQLDPIMRSGNFELKERIQSYGLLPHTGTTYTSDYRLQDKRFEGWVRCLITIDSKDITVSFMTVESQHGKRDYPPAEEVRSLAANITPKLRSYLQSRFPERALEVSELYWQM